MIASKKKTRKVWFDLEIYTYFSKSMKTEDDTITVGSYYVDEKNLRQVTAAGICDYIVENKSKFVNPKGIRNMRRCNIFRNVVSPHIFYEYISSDNSSIDTFMFVKNVRFA